MSLKIEELTQQVEMTKTAEEAEMEKLAETVNVLEQAQTLTLIGEDLCKFAEEAKHEVLGAIGQDLFNIGSRMGAALTKTATEGNYALVDSLEIAEDLNKIATVMAEIADESKDEEFTKLAEAVVEISNEMTTDANEIMDKIAVLDPQEGTADETKLKGWRLNLLRAKEATKGAFRATEAREFLKKTEGNLAGKLQHMLTTKAGLKALAPVVAAYGGSAAVAGGLGYAAYRRHNKKK